MMERLARALFLASLVAACGAAVRAQGTPAPPAPAVEYNAGAWKEFVSPEGRFSVNVVATLRPSKQQVDTAIGKIDNHLYIAQTGTGGYMVAYADFPPYPETPEAVVAILNGARDQVLSADKSRNLLSEKEITLEGYGGREWLVEDGKWLYRARTFMAKRRLYQVLLLAPLNVAFKSGRPSADARDFTDLYEGMSSRFFGSFKLLPAGGPAAPSPTPGARQRP